MILDIDLNPYSWVENPMCSFSAVAFQKLLATREATMTKKECLDSIKNYFNNDKDYIDTADEIEHRRELYYNKLVKEREDKELARYLSNNAFPYEILFRVVY